MKRLHPKLNPKYFNDLRSEKQFLREKKTRIYLDFESILVFLKNFHDSNEFTDEDHAIRICVSRILNIPIILRTDKFHSDEFYS